MNILIITTHFPPDSSIGAVRPYMFAKYLLQFGHQVTVLRSGEFYRQPDHSYPPLEGLRVISYLGENSPAEVYSRGGEVSYEPGKSPISFLPPAIRFPIAKIYHTWFKPVDVIRRVRAAKARFAEQKQALDKLRGERFDVVFATFPSIQNFWAGAYAAELFGSKWIMDLRDPIVPSSDYRGLSRIILEHIQDRALKQADAFTVASDGMRSSTPGLRKFSNKVYRIYNGYDPLPGTFQDPGPSPGVFSVCYTGSIFEKRTSVPLLRALRQLSEQGRIQLDRVRLEYAGPDFDFFRTEAEAAHMECILSDHGYVTREEAARIQGRSDIFLLLSWNTKGQLGMLSGKFYEGIRASKPILAIVAGDVPNSELYQINQRFHYGFCYEEGRDAELFPQLCDFLLQAYTQKMERGAVDYAPSAELSTHFRYDTLTRQLESLCKKLVYGEAADNSDTDGGGQLDGR